MAHPELLDKVSNRVPENQGNTQSILDEAKNIVYGAREAAYGHPKEDFARTAKLWSEILHAAVSAKDVALCMIALKLSREVNKHGRDNLVDIAGYAATIERLDEPTSILPDEYRPLNSSDIIRGHRFGCMCSWCSGAENDCRA